MVPDSCYGRSHDGAGDLRLESAPGGPGSMAGRMGGDTGGRGRGRVIDTGRGGRLGGLAIQRRPDPIPLPAESFSFGAS